MPLDTIPWGVERNLQKTFVVVVLLAAGFVSGQKADAGTIYGDGNIVNDNVAQLFNVAPGSPANATFNNTVAAVCP